MTLTCPHCTRKLADSTELPEPPSFCMFCGRKLDPSTFKPSNNLAETIDSPQNFNTDNDIPIPSDLDVDIGDRIAGYRLKQHLGTGGMGTVFKATHELTGEEVALKLLSGRLSSNPTSVERFRQEGRVASRITHPNCVFVIRADAERGRPYIVMELMPGRTLKDLVETDGPLSVSNAILRMLNVIDGLNEAHRLGVIHRDVKPSNCFLTENDHVKVGDFGLSKTLTKAPMDKDVSQTGLFLGTIQFASPEQIRGEPVNYDSDVYSVCATLYYLLSGRAPYQHESMTATLAKAVSEPPPSLREQRKEIPRALERVVFRGMERDRKLRWQSLVELRETLSELIPDRQTAAKPRMMVLAYAADVLLLQFVLFPMGIIFNILHGSSGFFHNSPLQASWPQFTITALYFTLSQGLWGTTLGKRLLRLQVTGIHETGPPGLFHALIRTVAFEAMLGLIYILPGEMLRLLPAPWNGILFVLAILWGIGLLCVQLKRSKYGYRGLHDLASGCRVVQRPSHGYRVELHSRYKNPLDQVLATSQPLPGIVGGFETQGKLCDLPDQGELWLAEDRSLGRTMLIRVLAIGMAHNDNSTTMLNRPTRLRVVGNGRIVWQNNPRFWLAYVAPIGAPLVDIVDPHKPLTWAETRILLEQLAGELEASEADGTGTWRPTIEQIWVEPTGRLQLLDFSLPVHVPVKGSNPAGGENNSTTLIRQLTTLCLEGKARATGGKLAAPLPPHASSIVNPIFEENKPNLVPALRYELANSYAQMPVVTSGIRFGHIGVQSAMLALGLLVMFLASGFLSLEMVLAPMAEIRAARTIVRDIDEPGERTDLIQRLQQIPNSQRRERIVSTLSDDNYNQTADRLALHADRLQDELDADIETLNPTERAILRNLNLSEPSDSVENLSTPLIAKTMTSALSQSEEDIMPTRAKLFNYCMIGLAIFPFIIWPIFAYLFRGGLSMKIAGITLVKQNGRKAGRFRCVLREMLVWTPLVLVLSLDLWVQAFHPSYVQTRTVIWLSGMVLLILYVVIALRYPDRPIQDRIVGTHLVPE